ELAEHAARGAADLAGAVAGVAGGGTGALPCPAPLAGAAAVKGLELDGALRAGGDLVQGELDVQPDVLPPALLPALPLPEEPLEAAEVAHEDVEGLAQVHVVEAPVPGGATAPAQPRLAVAVVAGALVGVLEHLVRLGDLLELRLRVRRGVAVGVE